MQEAFAAYSENLGKTVANLQSLEFLLRLFLHNSQVEPMWLETTPDQMQIGDVVTETPLTDWSTLAELIHRYNSAVSDRQELQVAKWVVDVRDALAHGRMFMADLSGAPPILIKFAKPSGGKVRVVFRADSDEWLDRALGKVAAETAKVQTALDEQRGRRTRG
jgi:hypothetical protein